MLVINTFIYPIFSNELVFCFCVFSAVGLKKKIAFFSNLLWFLVELIYFSRYIIYIYVFLGSNKLVKYSYKLSFVYLCEWRHQALYNSFIGWQFSTLWFVKYGKKNFQLFSRKSCKNICGKSYRKSSTKVVILQLLMVYREGWDIVHGRDPLAGIEWRSRS